jgi:hypothetical protein
MGNIIPQNPKKKYLIVEKAKTKEKNTLFMGNIILKNLKKKYLIVEKVRVEKK